LTLSKDTSNSGGGFNTFAFLSFLLSAVNAISVVSNNINNRRNNNNNNNNENNNNQVGLTSIRLGCLVCRCGQRATKKDKFG
jgi:hypothetical protein